MRTLISAVVCCVMTTAAQAQIEIYVHYLRQIVPPPPTLSNLDPVAEDAGLAGARLGLADNVTTGRFLGHSYTLDLTEVPEGGDLLSSARAALAQTRLLVIDAPAQALLAIADLPEAQDALLFNTNAPDTGLRDALCRANILHTLPSLAMRADALMQWMVQKRWTDLVMISGDKPADRAFADALDRAARKFGLEIRDRKDWVFDADMRRNAAQEVPLFTQPFGSYDALIVSDETRDFGRYIEYNTWVPRPVTGSEGLQPVAWAPVVEQWGAAQLQSRFRKTAGRDMMNQDYAAWAALRAIGEAVTRTGSDAPAALRAYMLGPEFELAGFKGRPLSFRPWNGQLRQPIPLVHSRALVAQAPLEGFLHQRTELDTLGLDAPESKCAAFSQ